MTDDIYLIIDDKQDYNLSTIKDLTTNFLSSKIYFEHTKFKIKYFSELNLKDNFFGIYIIPVKGSFEQWLIEKNILFFIDTKILDLVREGKIIIVIDNQSEGYNFFNKNVDGINELHSSIKLLNIPKNGLILITGDHNFDSIYSAWCDNFYESKLITHITFISWTCIFYNHDRIPDHPLVLDSLNNPKTKDFNSLNKSRRKQRVEHIFYLITQKILNQGLVSANFVLGTKYFEDLYQSVNYSFFEKILKLFLPIHIDGDWSENNPDDYKKFIFNHDIYKNSLLTFVTETEFYNNSLFITEKTFKPIAAGHPFLILGQHGILEKLQDLGYKTNFTMFSNYDKIKNDKARFIVVHENLKKWIKLSKQEKTAYILENMDKIKHNQELFRKNENFLLDNYNRLYDEVCKIKKS